VSDAAAHAETIREAKWLLDNWTALVDGGFSHESAVKAVAAGDLTLAEKA
jgi:hypothetical protein